jgi:nucleoside-diphosphate-sugar epimerase
MSNYLVTGGAGFIGSHVVERLLAEGHQVRVLDNFSTGRRENLRRCLAEIELFEGDLRSLHTVHQAVEGVDYVLHLGALPSVPRSVKTPVEAHAINSTGTLHVLLAAHEAGVRRLVFASSSSIYGDSPVLPKTEEMIPAPLSPYAASKIAGEHYCQVFDRLYGLETVMLRYFNVFGPRQDPSSPYSGVISLFITAALRGDPYTINGDGAQTRDLTFVQNVVQATIAASTAPGVAGEVMNVACGIRTSILELTRMLDRILGQDTPVVHRPPRAGDVLHSLADIGKARRLLDYKPAVDVLEGLNRTVAWYREHQG